MCTKMLYTAVAARLTPFNRTVVGLFGRLYLPFPVPYREKRPTLEPIMDQYFSSRFAPIRACYPLWGG